MFKKLTKMYTKFLDRALGEFKLKNCHMASEVCINERIVTAYLFEVIKKSKDKFSMIDEKEFEEEFLEGETNPNVLLKIATILKSVELSTRVEFGILPQSVLPKLFNAQDGKFLLTNEKEFVCDLRDIFFFNNTQGTNKIFGQNASRSVENREVLNLTSDILERVCSLTILHLFDKKNYNKREETFINKLKENYQEKSKKIKDKNNIVEEVDEYIPE